MVNMNLTRLSLNYILEKYEITILNLKKKEIKLKYRYV